MADERLEAPTTVRWSGAQGRAIERLANELGGSAGTAARYLLTLGLRWIAGERPPASETDSVIGVSLAAAGVGAGAGQLELIPEGVHPYAFRRLSLERKGWSDTAPERFAIYKLGSDEVASSMDPTIAPGSVLLVDREADRDGVEPRSIWVVRDERSPRPRRPVSRRAD